jgi:hypothetical protein
MGKGIPRRWRLVSTIKEWCCAGLHIKRVLGERIFISYNTRSYLCGIKNEGGISRARVNPVSWITNPNSHTPVINSISYFKRDVSLSSQNCMIDPRSLEWRILSFER